MARNKIVGIVIWGLGLILSMILMFCLCSGMTYTFWVTFGFVIVAFVSTLVFQLFVWKNTNTLDSQFIHIPALVISSVYALIQIPICVVFAVGATSIPCKVAILVNAIVLLLTWSITLSSMAWNEHTASVNSRQKNHHKEL